MKAVDGEPVASQGDVLWAPRLQLAATEGCTPRFRQVGGLGVSGLAPLPVSAQAIQGRERDG